MRFINALIARYRSSSQGTAINGYRCRVRKSTYRSGKRKWEPLQGLSQHHHVRAGGRRVRLGACDVRRAQQSTGLPPRLLPTQQAVFLCSDAAEVAELMGPHPLLSPSQVCDSSTETCAEKTLPNSDCLVGACKAFRSR